MALTPEDAIERGDRRFLGQVLRLEMMVDSALEEHAYHRRPVTVLLFTKGEFPYSVKAEVVRRFTEAGWDVDHSQADWKLTPTPKGFPA